MKKIIIILTIVLLLFSCASAPKEQPFTVDLKAPSHEIGTIEAYVDRPVSVKSSIGKSEIGVSYYPEDDAVCLQFKAMYFIGCQQFWDRDGREAFIAAFERYKEDFEQRTLIKASKKKTRQAYGEVNSYFAWKKSVISEQAHGSSKTKIGYHFKEKAAFFSVTQMETYYESYASRSRNQTSGVTSIYFTQAQAEALIALFNDEYLRKFGRRGGYSVPDVLDEY